MPCSGRRFPLTHWLTIEVAFTPLCQVADLVTGITPPGDPALFGGPIPLFRPGDLDRRGPLHSARDTVTELGARHGRLLPAGAVLVSCIGLLGKVGLLAQPAITNQQITALVPRPGILPEYVFYWAQTLRPWLYQSASATTLPIINKTRLGRAPFPVLPLGEQRRIVASLQAAELRHQRATAELAEVPTLLGQLRRSLLTSALRGELGALPSLNEPPPTPERPPPVTPLIPVVPLGQVARVQVGYAFRSSWFTRHGVRLLRGVNVAPGAVTWSQAVHLPEPEARRYESYVLQAGDIVIGLDRPVISTGVRVAKLGPADLPALLVQRVGRLVPRDVTGVPFDSDYLLLCLQSERMLEHLVSRATGTQLPHISPATIESAPLLLPPLAVQRRIAAQTAAAWQQVATAAEQTAAAQEQLDELWQTLLGRAFARCKSWSPVPAEG